MANLWENGERSLVNIRSRGIDTLPERLQAQVWPCEKLRSDLL